MAKRSNIEMMLSPGLRQKCRKCSLSETSYPVSSRGNPQAKILGIGEAAGKIEEQSDLFFVGPAGKLLSDILDNINFPLDKYFLLWNICRCRPQAEAGTGKENRSPTSEEAKACRPYLIEVVNKVEPKLIVLIGKVALENLTSTKLGINVLKGSFISPAQMNIGNCPGFVLEHPAAILRNQDHLKDWIRHLIRIRDYHLGLEN